MARGRSKEHLRLLRKKYKLGEYAPKKGKRAFKKAAKAARKARKLAMIDFEAALKATGLNAEGKPSKEGLLGRMQRGNRRIRAKYTGRRNPEHGVVYLADPYDIRPLTEP